MIVRLWFVLSVIWAGLFLANGATRPGGIQPLDVAIGVLPFLLSGGLRLSVRYIRTGSFRRIQPWRY